MNISDIRKSNQGYGEYRATVTGPFFRFDVYNPVGDMILSQWLEQPQHLDNSTQELDCMPVSQGDVEMATKINRAIMIDGVKRWIHANTEQEYADKLLKLVGQKGPPQSAASTHSVNTPGIGSRLFQSRISPQRQSNSIAIC